MAPKPEIAEGYRDAAQHRAISFTLHELAHLYTKSGQLSTAAEYRRAAHWHSEQANLMDTRDEHARYK